ncbi:MAG TPA: sigma-70 family RNA polymerase sigma factor [Thermoanaerobaculia bacterium]|jgi:RNA polymerase sigma-70 factor (ECF subfamily)
MGPFQDPDSFRPFVEAHFAELASFARSILGSGLEAEDVAQEALIRLYRNRRRLRAEASPRAFAYRIAQRLCLSHLRRMSRRRALAVLLAPLADRESAPAPDPVDWWFTELPRRQRAIAHLHFAENRDAPEIAAILGIAASTVRVQLARIRSKLRSANTSSLKSERCSHAS